MKTEGLRFKYEFLQNADGSEETTDCDLVLIFSFLALVLCVTANPVTSMSKG